MQEKTGWIECMMISQPGDVVIYAYETRNHLLLGGVEYSSKLGRLLIRVLYVEYRTVECSI